MKSLRNQLTIWSVGLLTLVGLIAGGISYLLAQKGAGVFLDHQLRLVAGSVDEGSQLPAMQTRFLGESEQQRQYGFVIQVSLPKEAVRSSRPDFDLPVGKASGYSEQVYQGEKWRIYTIVYPDRTVQVSQADAVRRAIASDAALFASLPIAGLLPLCWVLVAFGVKRILKPLADVTLAVTLRDARSLTPIAAKGIPAEAAPLITEINSLLLRIQESMESQRHFVLDAAHELRTPLAALQLQIDNLSQSLSPEDMNVRINELRFGMQRASHIVAQLLKMARYEGESESIRSRLDLGELVKHCISTLIPVAEKSGIDLGMVRDDKASISANADDLRILFDNLLDNAIHYTQDGGKVDVAVEVSGSRAAVSIVDNGCGIPEELLPRVFDRFFRAGNNKAEGSGIGLAIVNAIARRENAEVRLANRKDAKGLIVTVSFDLHAL